MNIPLAIERVERARGQGDDVRLRLFGRWLTARDVADLDALLIVQMHGRRHRFPARHEPDLAAEAGQDAWIASFALPDWAVPDQPGQASLWVGTAIVPVPPPGSTPEPVEVEQWSQVDGDAAEGEPGGSALQVDRGTEALPASAESGRSGPLAEMLLKDTVTALHGELEQRAAEIVRLRSELARRHADLEARAAHQTELQTAHGELRHELAELMGAATRQRISFDERLDAGRAERDQIAAERDGMAAERDGIAAERDRAYGERDALTGERDEAISERDRAHDERDAMAGERDGMAAERDRAYGERDEAAAERDRALAQRDALTADRDRATAEARASGEELERTRGELEDQLARMREETARQLRTARDELDQHLQTAREEFERETAVIQTRADAEAGALDERLAAATAAQRRAAQGLSAMREQLAAAQVARDAALSEAEGLRDELERLGSELTISREQDGGPAADLGEAQQLLADARALTETLRGDITG